MSDVRSCKGKAVRTESKDLAPHHHFAFLISNFSFKRSFHTESKGAPPHGLTLTIPFSAFLTRHAAPPLSMTDRGEIGRQRRSECLAGQIGEIIRKRRKGERSRMKELAADVERL